MHETPAKNPDCGAVADESPASRQTAKGPWAGLGISLSAEDSNATQTDMRHNVPSGDLS
jgi:hypothetical protein